MQKIVRPERESEFWFEDKIVNRQGGKKHREHSWADASDPGAQDDGGKEKRRAKRVAPERKRDGQSNGDGYNRQRVMTNSMLEDAMRRALLGIIRSEIHHPFIKRFGSGLHQEERPREIDLAPISNSTTPGRHCQSCFIPRKRDSLSLRGGSELARQPQFQATIRSLRSSESRSRSERNDRSEVSSVSSSALRKLSIAAWKWFSCLSNSPSTAYSR